MADRIRLTCWPTPERYGLGIQIQRLDGLLHNTIEEIVQIDTGYSETMLIPYPLYRRLELEHWRVPHLIKPHGTAVTGQVIAFIEANARVVIPQTGQIFSTIIQTFEGNTRFLIGRALLHQIKVLLDGPGGQTCLLSPIGNEE